MILAAGLGTRLRPLTERWPKPAIPLLGQPLFRYHLSVLRAAGVEGVGINTHHLGDVMKALAKAECDRAGMSLSVVHEPEIQGTGGGIRGLKGFLSGGTFVVLNGDILFPVPLNEVLTAHRASGAAATMVLLPMPPGEKYAAVEMDPSRSVRRIAGHGPGGEKLSPWHFTGVHVMEPAVFDFMAERGAEDINREVYPRLLAAGLRIHGHVANCYWSDLGTPSRYLATVQQLLSGQVNLAALGDGSPFLESPRSGGNFHAHPSAHVGGKVAGPAYFAKDSRVEPGALIGGGVAVETGATVQTRARLNRAVVLDDTTISAGEELVETIAWGQHRIPAALG